MALIDRAVAVHLAGHEIVVQSDSQLGQQTLNSWSHSQPSSASEQEEVQGSNKEAGRPCGGRDVDVRLTTMAERRSIVSRVGGVEVREADMSLVGDSELSPRRLEMQAVGADGYLHPLPCPARLKHSSETPENDAISCSDAESDSGFESGTHTSCLSEATNTTHNEPVTIGSKCEDSESDEDERIEKAILHLDVKVDRSELSAKAVERLRLLPSGYLPLPHQVAGHMHVDGQIGFLHKADQYDILYKPVQAGNKGQREVSFYEGLFSLPEVELSRDLQRLKKLIPGYYGVCDITDRAGETYRFMKLEDVVSRFHKPCILDIKVRRRHFNETTDQRKIDNERRKYPLQEVLGFRISGMRVYQSASDDYVYFDKEFGRSFSISEALESLRVFFLDGSHKRIDAIAAISDRLYDFLDWIQTQASYKLFATSLLIIYEGDSNQPIKSPEQLIDVRWVDFAYACELKCEEQSQLTLDENVLFGLKNLIQFLERLK